MRRAYFLERLREKLQDPEFCGTEGYPIGSDEDILALSDPPYYTACPNPFVADFVHGDQNSLASREPYIKEPLAVDVTGGKNDSIYNAHSYPTKVPPRAIMRYILHYTEPGDLIFDGFCGTGMTGVAAQLCGDRQAVESLGLLVLSDGTILGEGGQIVGSLGVRSAVMSDLSPAATFIAANYCAPVGECRFDSAARGILSEVQRSFEPLFEAPVPGEHGKRTLDYSVWSDVFTCPSCGSEVCYWDACVDTSQWKLIEQPRCGSCAATLRRRDLDRAWSTVYDPALGEPTRRAKKLRVWDVCEDRVRCEGPVRGKDRTVLTQQEAPPGSWYPTDAIPPGDKTSDPFASGVRYVHQYWSPRTLAVLSALWAAGRGKPCQNLIWFLITSSLDRVSLRNGYRPQHKNNRSRELGGPLPGNLYVPTFSVELNPIKHIGGRVRGIDRMLQATPIRGHVAISTQSTTGLRLPPNSVDYVFVDPPFGSNLMYSELSFAMESWLRVKTNDVPEAIVNQSQHKDELAYTNLMSECFRRAFESLKPGHWMTVEFHNSRNAIWNSIQEALARAGFVVADVRSLDRNLGSLNQIAYANAVKQDLIISAYKPEAELERHFALKAGATEGAWEFVRAHLRQLPVLVLGEGGRADTVAERLNYLLFDRMVAFHVQRGVTVPLSASEFYSGLDQRFPERDGMYFLPDQVAEYDKKRLQTAGLQQIKMFVTDESSAIQWLRQQLRARPQTFQELHPQFMKEIAGWERHEKPLELSDLLAENFLRYGGQGEVPSQIHAYLSSNYKDLRNLAKDDPRLQATARDRWYVPDPNKAQDLEKLRERELLQEFDEYRASRERTLKVFRLEAVRAGFKHAWQEHDYDTIVRVARKIPQSILQEDPKLLMWYDQALLRSGAEE